MGRVVAVIGASNDRRKFGNKAVRAFVRQGYDVKPVNPKTAMVEGLPTYASVSDIPGPVDLITVYVPPEIGERLLPEIASKQPAELWINPGAESDTLLAKAAVLGLQPIVACSILGHGENPSAF